MGSTMSRLASSIVVMAIAAGAAGRASGQSVFDPYQPESAPYYNYTTATQPTNLAMPNAAREAGAYQALNYPSGGTSRYNTFDRHLDESDPYASPRRLSGPGISYSQASRSLDAPRDRTYQRTREAEQRFVNEQARLVEIEAERSALYRKMMREKDPTRRSQIYREIQTLSASRAAADRAPAPRAYASASAPSVPAYGPPPLLARPRPTTPTAEPSPPRGTRPETTGTREVPPASTPARRVAEPIAPSRRPRSSAELPDPSDVPDRPVRTIPPAGNEPSPPIPIPDLPPR